MAFQGVMLQVYEVLIGWTYVVLSLLLLAKIWQLFNLTENFAKAWNWASGQAAATPGGAGGQAGAGVPTGAAGGAGAPGQVQNFQGRMVP